MKHKITRHLGKISDCYNSEQYPKMESLKRVHIKIIPYQQKYLDDMVQLYLQCYSTPTRPILPQYGHTVIRYCVKAAPAYCFLALAKKNCLGGIFCAPDPTYFRKTLILHSVQVEPAHRQQGIGTLLLSRLLKTA